MLDDHDFPKQLSILTPQTHLGQLKLNIAQHIFIPICNCAHFQQRAGNRYKLNMKFDFELTFLSQFSQQDGALYLIVLHLVLAFHPYKKNFCGWRLSI